MSPGKAFLAHDRPNRRRLAELIVAPRGGVHRWTRRAGQ